jgi:hypothetical protein
MSINFWGACSNKKTFASTITSEGFFNVYIY